MRDQYPAGGAGHRIQAEKRFVWQAYEREARLNEVPAGRAQCVSEVLPQGHLDRLL